MALDQSRIITEAQLRAVGQITIGEVILEGIKESIINGDQPHHVWRELHRLSKHLSECCEGLAGQVQWSHI